MRNAASALLVAAGMLAFAPGAARAQWYVGADVGANVNEDASVSAGTNNKTEYDWGAVGLGQVGYSFGAPKVEFELGYRAGDVSKVGGASGGGDIGALSTMVNGVWDFMPTSRVHPFLGAGIGAAHVVANDAARSGTWAYSGKDWQFAYQGIAGLGYDLTRNLMVKSQYRYFATTDYDVTAAANAKGSAGYANHAILVGLTWKFGPAAPAPVAAPAPAPVPAAAPAVMPAPPPAAKAQRNFMVFFDFDRSELNAEAQRIVMQAAVAAKSGGVVRVNVTGHTDLAGADKYNMALSLKRADNVRAALMSHGVHSDEIFVGGRGKREPMVPTADGMREAQNRRVEINLE
jgi:outer membrane protein OmpA-like peptidoglycan-associated protein